MFNNRVFYHEHVRKAIIAFGTIFNNINIQRKNKEGEIVQSVRVPLSYVPKQKTIQRMTEVGDLDNGRAKYEITLPRIGFEISSLSYDAPRKLAVTQNVRSINTTDNSFRNAFVSTPYNMGISMSVFAKNQDDGLQIIEQILPYFNPDFNITINEIPELGAKRDLQIVLDNVTYNDEYTGTYDERVTITWDLNFTVKLNFYGYVQNAEVIKKSIQSIYAVTKTSDPIDANTQVGVRITTEVSPIDADPTDDYVFIQDFDDIFTG